MAHAESSAALRAGAPAAQGLYDPASEHDACGVAFVATMRGTPGRDIVDAALTGRCEKENFTGNLLHFRAILASARLASSLTNRG